MSEWEKLDLRLFIVGKAAPNRDKVKFQVRIPQFFGKTAVRYCCLYDFLKFINYCCNNDLCPVRCKAKPIDAH